MDNRQTQTYLNKFWKYTGSSQSDEIQAFLSSSPGAASGVGRLSNALAKMTGGTPIAKLNKGGLAYAKGGQVTKPPVKPNPVNKPQKPGAEPVRFKHGFNVISGGKEHGTYYNPKTQKNKIGTKASASYTIKGSNQNQRKAKIAAEVKAKLKEVNKPWHEWNRSTNRYKKELTKYKQYEKELKSYNVKLEKYNTYAANQAAEMQEAANKLTKDALTDPGSVIEKPTVTKINPNAKGTTIDPSTGKVTGDLGYDATTVTDTETVSTPTEISAETYDASTTTEDVEAGLSDVDAEEGTVSDDATVDAATMDPETTGVKDLEAAQGKEHIMENPVQREIEDGELITGVADAAKASKFTEQIQAATADPSEKTMVKNQLESLMADFEGGETPAWAAGALRSAMGAMAARGLGASSMAGQAAVQAAMESALPIAMADAQTQSQFEQQNLSNRQQRAMLAAQQRAQFMGQEFDQAFQARVQNASKISDVANMNFNAEQQVALENSRAANTMNLANLSNRQAMVMAEAAAISQLEQQNLSNEQQAAVQNANAFLQMDMTNLNNRQQTNMFKAQSLVQSIFTDKAAENAAKQFNATSENQVKQFMATMKLQAETYNANAINATNQFNAGAENAEKQYNAGLREQRKQFNSSNRLAIVQANALWRQNVTTLNTAEKNLSNREYAKDVNALTNKSLDEIWQRERDIMDYTFKNEDNNANRILSLLLADKDLEAVRKELKYQENKDKSNVLFKLFWPF